MKGVGLEDTVSAGAGAPTGETAHQSDGEESDRNSVCSNSSRRSDMSTLSNMSASQRNGRGKHGAGQHGGGNRSMHISFSSETSGNEQDKCSISIEQQSALDASKMSLCIDFKQLCPEGRTDGLLQCLQMNRYDKPNKLQQHVIPAVMHLMGKELGGQTGSAGKGKSCIVIQGPAKSGKTSAAVIAELAAIDAELAQPQVLLLSSSPKRDFDKLLSVLTLMQNIRYQAFWEEEGDPDRAIDEGAPEVKASRTAHILVGHPRMMLKLLSSVPTLCLDSVRALVIDDVEELLYQLPQDAGSEKNTTSQASEASAKAGAGGRVGGYDGINASDGGAASTSPLLDDIVQICNVLEARQYSHNMSDTYRIRSGHDQSIKCRYVILSQALTDAASRKCLRLLKNSLMKKRNLLDADSCPPPTKIIKAMKHYYAMAPRDEWVRVFAGLVQSLMFPRALIFCDDENIERYGQEMQDMGIAVSVNLPDASGASESRRRAVQDFTTNRTQFLLTRAEPAVCQIVLPKVSSVFHFGLPKQLPSVYGVRLLPLDAANVKDAPSILFVDAARGNSSSAPQLVRSVGRLFDVDFMDMPFEFLPAQPAGGGGRRGRARQ